MADRASGRLGRAVLVLVTAAVYFAAAKLGLRLAFVAEQVSPVWPPTGIALAAVLILGRQVWPGIALGAFLANATAHESIPTACGIAVGNTLEALVGAWFLERSGFHAALDHLRDVLRLVLFAAGVSTAVSATIGVLSLCLGGVQPWSAFDSLWWVWWFGDAMGDVVVAPLLLAWAATPRVPREPRRLVEGVALLAAVAALASLVFVAGSSATGYPLHYTIFPLVIWAALRFGQRGTATVTAVAAAVAIWSTAKGLGPFATANPHMSLILLQLFTAVVAITGLLLGAAMSERDAARERAAADYARLLMSEERLRLALAAGRMGVWDWTIPTGEVVWSADLAAIFGLPALGVQQSMEGFLALVHPDDREAVRRSIADAVAREGGYDVEFRAVWPDGSIRWIGGKGTVLRDQTGGPVRMLGVGLDVTERRRLEEELRERASELADADRRKDEFLAMLAHELRNPLAPLSAALHLLGSDAVDRQRFIQMGKRQVRQLVHLVDDLLDVSRITQGKITLRRERVVLGDVIARAVESARPLMEARRHRFSVSLPAEPVRLDADPGRLAQVIANLLGNAAKYTPPDGAVSLAAALRGDQVVIRVSDTGVGLTPELRSRIFDLFVQGDTSLDRGAGGLGLGLTIARRLVEMHGGHIAAESAGPGQGSEFVVTLPAAPAGTTATAPPPLPSRRPDQVRRLRILLVEDHLDAAESLATVFELWGHAVWVAHDGPAAVEIAEREQLDVVVSDIGLPGMDGYALVQGLRERGIAPKAVLIALSGYGREEDKRRAREAGFDHHLVKPPDMSELGDLLGRLASAA